MSSVFLFVQSGYLMGKLFFEAKYSAVDGKADFYWARYLRLAPALYVNVIVCWLLYSMGDHSLLKLGADLLFVNNFTGPGINNVTWSLSHEFQYYLLAPLVFLAFRRNTLLLAIAIGVAFAIGLGFWPFCLCLHVPGVGFSVNLMPRTPTTQGAKNIGLVAGLFVLHIGFNILFFFHLPVAADICAALASVFLVWICERPSERRSSVALRWGMLTGYLTYGFYSSGITCC